MRFVKDFLVKLAHANVIVASTTTSAAYVSGAVMKISITPQLLLIPFSVTFAVYTLNRYTDKEDEENHPERHGFTERHKRAMISLAALSYILALVLGLLTGFLAFFVVLLPFIAVLFYSLKVLPRGRRLKDIVVVKNVTIALTWGLSVTLLPLTVGSARVETVLFVFTFFFLRFFINTVVFDMRDVKGDAKEGVRSIPVVLGYERTRRILLWLNLVVGALVVLGWLSEVVRSGDGVALLFSCVYARWYLGRVRGAMDIRFLCDVVVDGEDVVLSLLLFVLF